MSTSYILKNIAIASYRLLLHLMAETKDVYYRNPPHMPVMVSLGRDFSLSCSVPVVRSNQPPSIQLLNSDTIKRSIEWSERITWMCPRRILAKSGGLCFNDGAMAKSGPKGI